MTNEKVPRRLYNLIEARKYFSEQFNTLKNMWRMNHESDVQADNGNWYHADYVRTNSGDEYITLKRLHNK